MRKRGSMKQFSHWVARLMLSVAKKAHKIGWWFLEKG